MYTWHSRRVLVRWAAILKAVRLGNFKTATFIRQYEVSMRVLRRDFDALREIGVDLEYDPHLYIWRLSSDRCQFCGQVQSAAEAAHSKTQRAA